MLNDSNMIQMVNIIVIMWFSFAMALTFTSENVYNFFYPIAIAQVDGAANEMHNEHITTNNFLPQTSFAFYIRKSI